MELEIKSCGEQLKEIDIFYLGKEDRGDSIVAYRYLKYVHTVYRMECSLWKAEPEPLD